MKQSRVPAFCACNCICERCASTRTPLDHPPLHSIIRLPQATDDALLEAALLIKRALS